MRSPTRSELADCLRAVRYRSKRGVEYSMNERVVEAAAGAVEALLAAIAEQDRALPLPGSMRLDGDPPYCGRCRKSARLHKLRLWRHGGTHAMDPICEACFEVVLGRKPFRGMDEAAWPAVFDEVAR